MDEIIKIEFLGKEEFRHLRIIKCTGDDFNKFKFFLLYTRDFAFSELDELDNAILQGLNEFYNADLIVNQKILFKNQLNKIVERYTLKEVTPITIQLNPIVTDELISKMEKGLETYCYNKFFNVRFVAGINFSYLNTFYLGFLDNEKLIELQATIKVI